MDNTMTIKPAIAFAGFGMPACGHAAMTTSGRTGAFGTRVGAGFPSVVRDRQVIVGADLGLAKAYTPGTSAWRPPSS